MSIIKESLPQEEDCGNINFKDSLIIQTYTHALLKDSTENVSYFYANHENVLKKNLTLEKIKELFQKIFQKNSPVTLASFLSFFKQKIKINEPFQAIPQSTLLQLVSKKRISFLTDLLKVFSDEIDLTLSEKDLPSGESYLLNAAKTNNPELVRLLLKSPKINMQNLNVNRRFYETRGDYLLTWATNGGHFNILKLLKKRFPDSIDINVVGGFNETSLIIAAKKGLVKIVDWILETFGENVNYNYKDINEDTAFSKALENEKFEVCEKILNKYKDVLIFYAKKNGMEIFETLIMKSLYDSLKYFIDFLDKSPIYREKIKPGSLEKALGLAILKENFDVVKEIVNKFHDLINLEYVTEDGKGFLSMACENSTNENLTFLLNSCPDLKKMVLKPDKFGETPLSLAIRANKYENCFFLIERLSHDELSNIQMNSKVFEKTLLLLTQKAQWSLVQGLLMQNLIVSIEAMGIKQDNNNTIVHYISRGGQLSLFKFLYQTYTSDIQMIINCQNSDLETPLTMAARYAHWDLVLYMLEIPGISYLTKDSSNRSFLCYVFSEGEEEIILKIVHHMKNVLDINYSFLGLIKRKLWTKVILLIKIGVVDTNFYDLESGKSTLNLIVENMETSQEQDILKIFRLFDFAQQEIINTKTIVISLVQKQSLNVLKEFLKKVKFHDFNNKEVLEISEQLVNISQTKLFQEIFECLVHMFENSNDSIKEVDFWNTRLIKMLPYNDKTLEEWQKNCPFRLNVAHKFADIKGISLIEYIVEENHEESLKFLLEFCEKYSIYLPNLEALVIKSLRQKKPGIAKTLMLHRLFDINFIDENKKPLIYTIVMENNLELLQYSMKKLQSFDKNYLNRFGESAIVLAAQKNCKEILGYFIEVLELNFTYKNHEGRSFLYYMVINQCFDYLSFLCKTQKQIIPLLDEPDHAGLSPLLALAKTQKFKECEDFLLFTKTLTPLDIPIVNLWRVSKENKSFSDYLKVGNENVFKAFRKYGILECRAKLIENDLIKNVLTNSESTQLSLVDQTIKSSVQRLQNTFNLKFQEIDDEVIKIKNFFARLLKIDIDSHLGKHISAAFYSAKLMKYRSPTSQTMSLAEFLQVANDQAFKMLNNLDYVHCSAHIKYQELMALIWKAIHDVNQFTMLNDEEKHELIMQRQSVFVRHLFEASRDGICARGQFNKTLECLNYAHDDIKIDMLDFSNKILIMNKQAINSIWKKFTMKTFDLLPKELQKKFGNMVYYWGELEQEEIQSILGSYKEIFSVNFVEFFPDLAYKEPKIEDYMLLEDVLGVYHKKQMIDFPSCLE